MEPSDGKKARPATTAPARVSKAPPPITPLNPKPLDLRNHYTIRPVNWTRWRRLDRARLWEAACLVAGFEPPKDGDEELWAGYQLKGLPQSFFEVWEAVNRDELFCLTELQPASGRMLHTVHVGYFAMWAMLKDFQIAPEMRDIADRYKRARPSMVAQFNEAYGIEDASSAINPVKFVPMPAPAAGHQKPALPPGLNKQQVCMVFGTFDHFKDWGRALADPPEWLKEARLHRGFKEKKQSALWNPVAIAVALLDKGVPFPKLDRLFDRYQNILKPWTPAWEEKTRFYP